MAEPLLEIRGLHKSYWRGGNEVPVLRDLDAHLANDGGSDLAALLDVTEHALLQA